MVARRDARRPAAARPAPGRSACPSVRANTLVQPPGSTPERGVGAGDAGGHLVERAVAAVADDHVDAAAGGVLGEAGGVAAAVGLDDLHLVALRSGARCTTTVLRAVTDDAKALTTSRIRKAPDGSGIGPPRVATEPRRAGWVTGRTDR